MILYMKLGKVRGLSIEIDSALGIKPLYKKTSHHCETVVDVPYIQLIYTSGLWAPRKRVTQTTVEDAANDDTGTGKKTG